MRIDRVSVTYGELRSTGYPSYSNHREEVMLSATVETGETPRNVIDRLHVLAKDLVKARFGDSADGQIELDIPF